MRTVREVLTNAKLFLDTIPLRQIVELMSDALQISSSQLHEEAARPLTAEELKRCCHFFTRRQKGEPPQYIRGYVEFHDCKIHVNRDVLIPRQETEILTGTIIRTLQTEGCRNKTLWDVCCGSGCIGIAIKKACPDVQVILSDISFKALEAARRNAKENHVDVKFLQGDLLTPFQGEKADYFVCNPPYIAHNEILAKEVREFEPKLALFAKHNGLEFYERLSRELGCYLSPRGKAWMEIGYAQGESVQKLFSSDHWKTVCVERDWSGHDRFFFLENQ